MASQYSQEKTYSSLQPKFKDCQYDNSQGTDGVFAWIALLGGITRNVSNGLGLENFLDHYLERELQSEKTRPKILDDQALCLDDMDDPSASLEPMHGEAEGDSIGSQDTWSQRSHRRASSLRPGEASSARGPQQEGIPEEDEAPPEDPPDEPPPQTNVSGVGASLAASRVLMRQLHPHTSIPTCRSYRSSWTRPCSSPSLRC